LALRYSHRNTCSNAEANADFVQPSSMQQTRHYNGNRADCWQSWQCRQQLSSKNAKTTFFAYLTALPARLKAWDNHLATINERECEGSGRGLMCDVFALWDWEKHQTTWPVPAFGFKLKTLGIQMGAIPSTRPSGKVSYWAYLMYQTNLW
jgi:hypothetical protein